MDVHVDIIMSLEFVSFYSSILVTRTLPFSSVLLTSSVCPSFLHSGDNDLHLCYLFDHKNIFRKKLS